MKLLLLIPVITLVTALSLLLSACTSPLPYTQADLSVEREQRITDGYVDKEVSAGVHVIEVRHEDILALTIQKEKTLSNLKSIWQQRAKELCPKGHQGEPEVIQPDEARTNEFFCTLNICQKYLLVSGIAYCKTVYEF
jgi:hypothetical protein